MSLCSNGQSPIIEWQYPGEDKQRILGADNYQLVKEQGKCQTVYHVAGTSAKNGVNYCEVPVLNNNWGLNIPGPIHGIRSKYIRTDDKYSCPNYTSIVGKANVYAAYVSYGLNPNDDHYTVMYFYEPH